MPRLPRRIVSNNRDARRAAASIKQPRRILRLWQVLERTGLSKTTIYRAIEAGQFPRSVPILHGGKASGWDETEVDAFLDGRFAARDETRLRRMAQTSD
jgi:prophage regulatory protein